MARNSKTVIQDSENIIWAVLQHNVAPDGPIPVSFNRSHEGAKTFINGELDDGFVVASDFEIIPYTVDP